MTGPRSVDGSDGPDLSDLLAATGDAIAAGLGERSGWEPLAPMVSRLARKDSAAPVRLRRGDGRIAALAAVPSGVLVGRTVESESSTAHDAAANDTLASDGTAPLDGMAPLDVTVRAGVLLAWFDGGDEPPRVDGAWRAGLPPRAGWRQVDTVPDDVVRDLVRQGALAHVEAAGRAFGAAQGAEALLDAVVLTVRDGALTVELTNRELAAVTSMGFLPRGAQVRIAVSGRWNRIAAPFGTVYAERAGAALTVL